MVVVHEIIETSDHQLLDWERLRCLEDLLKRLQVLFLEDDQVFLFQKLCDYLF